MKAKAADAYQANDSDTFRAECRVAADNLQRDPVAWGNFLRRLGAMTDHDVAVTVADAVMAACPNLPERRRAELWARTMLGPVRALRGEAALRAYRRATQSVPDDDEGARL